MVSSAKSNAKKFTEFGRQFIKIRKIIGPKIDPCGTPTLMYLLLEIVLFTHTACCLSLR